MESRQGWIELKSGGLLSSKWREGSWAAVPGIPLRLDISFGSACHVCNLTEDCQFEVVRRMRLKTGKEIGHPTVGGLQVITKGWPRTAQIDVAPLKRYASETPEKVRAPNKRMRATSDGMAQKAMNKASSSPVQNMFAGTWTVTVSGQLWGKAHVSPSQCFFTIKDEKYKENYRLPFKIEGDGTSSSPFIIADGGGIARLLDHSSAGIREWRLCTGNVSVWRLDEQVQELLDIDESASPMSRCLTRALAVLRPGAAKGRLVGRHQEQADIKQFLSDAIRSGGRSQCLYVSGMPGTGKTASVLEVISGLQKASETDSCPNFTFAHVNGMCLSSPSGVFPEILHQVQQFDARRLSSSSAAYEELCEIFSRSSDDDNTIVLLLDEIDCLVTKGQSVLYQLFDWLSLPHVRLALVAIANTIDLPERLLPRIASRLGVMRVNFATYDRPQLRHIMDDRLYLAKAEDAFTKDALELCAARVAANHGDARKALQVCRRAIEIQFAECSAEDLRPVTLKQIATAEESLLRVNPASKAIGGLSLKSRRFLLAAVLEFKRCDNLLIPLRDALRRYVGVMATCDRRELGNNHPDLSDSAVQAKHVDDAHFIVQRLEAMSLLKVHCTGAWHEEASSCMGSARMDGCAQEMMLGLGESLDADDVADALSSCLDEDTAGDMLSQCDLQAAS